MRRSDREVTDIGGIRSIIESCKTCHVAMLDGNTPYVVPLSFGYTLESGVLTLYFHSAQEGRKLNILHENNSVCFEMCYEGELLLSKGAPCNSGYCFASVMGFGAVDFVSDVQEKCRALSLLMERQTGKAVTFTNEQANAVCVFKITSASFTGKRKPRPAAE